MKKDKNEITSQYWRVRCMQTRDEQVVWSEAEALAWAKKVVHTFQKAMTFEIVRVVEATSRFVERPFSIGDWARGAKKPSAA